MISTIASLWNNAKVRGITVQAVGAIAFVALFGYFIHNAIGNMNRMGITSGFGFIGQPANFAIGETMIDYSSSDSYGKAIVVGLLNTIKVAVIAAVLSTFLGTLLGVMRMSANPLLRGLVQAYVETIRNTPLLLQLFFWYSTILILLPAPRQALIPLPGFFLSNRGFRVPALIVDQPGLLGAAVALFAIVSAATVWINRRHRERTGSSRPTAMTIVAFAAAIAIAFRLLAGPVATLELPELKGFNFVGGSALTPEFAALLFGLTLYTAAFISEIVRSGIENVSLGQREAARSLGLKWGSTMRFVVLPQALRVVVPPLTSTYMTLTKNSSLAVAIGYPDLVNVVNTTMNQTGQAVETIAILMGTYLTLAISISLFMNWYNRRVAIKER